MFEEKLLTDPAVGDAWTKVTFFKIVFDKKSDEAKKFRVTRGPALLILDCRKPEKPKTIKKITGGNPLIIKLTIEKAAKIVAK